METLKVPSPWTLISPAKVVVRLSPSLTGSASVIAHLPGPSLLTTEPVEVTRSRADRVHLLILPFEGGEIFTAGSGFSDAAGEFIARLGAIGVLVPAGSDATALLDQLSLRVDESALSIVEVGLTVDGPALRASVAPALGVMGRALIFDRRKVAAWAAIAELCSIFELDLPGFFAGIISGTVATNSDQTFFRLLDYRAVSMDSAPSVVALTTY